MTSAHWCGSTAAHPLSAADEAATEALRAELAPGWLLTGPLVSSAGCHVWVVGLRSLTAQDYGLRAGVQLAGSTPGAALAAAAARYAEHVSGRASLSASRPESHAKLLDYAGWHDWLHTTADLADQRALADSPALQAAFAEVRAALPFGFLVGDVTTAYRTAGRPETPWRAFATAPYLTAGSDSEIASIAGAPSVDPAAALLSLAERLGQYPDRTTASPA